MCSSFRTKVRHIVCAAQFNNRGFSTDMRCLEMLGGYRLHQCSNGSREQLCRCFRACVELVFGFGACVYALQFNNHDFLLSDSRSNRCGWDSGLCHVRLSVRILHVCHINITGMVSRQVPKFNPTSDLGPLNLGRCL